MKKIRNFSDYIKESNGYNITDINDVDKEIVLDMCVEAFGDLESSDEIKEYLNDTVDWTLSKKCVMDGRIVGCYLLNEESVVDFLEGSDCATEDLSKYKNLSGIQGIAIVVIPEYKSLGIGREMRALPLKMNYDYYWGQELKGLNNVENWKRFGMRVVADGVIHGDDMYVTLMDL